MGAPIRELFRDDPTRPLEEVQKVHDSAAAEEDVREFYETESARRALHELADLIERPNARHRFLYINATFGSGKTHLLKLVGYLTRHGGAPAHVAEQLTDEWGGFERLDEAMRSAETRVDAYHPVFLNLLDRDASAEPPLPLLLWKALASRLGYPTEPLWLMEWAYQRDQTDQNCWDDLESQEHDERSLQEVLEDRAFLRSWLHKVAPETCEGLETEEDVAQSIREAQSNVDHAHFDAGALAERVRGARSLLEDATNQRVEFIFGLDEVALFVGDDPKRYDEFYETIEQLSDGPNPVVVGTGQWDLKTLHEDFRDDDLPETYRRVRLEGAESDDIVRNRWLRKESGGDLVDRLEHVPLAHGSDPDRPAIALDDVDPLDTYPFRPTDLRLLRNVMEEILTEGTTTEHEHVQARALLIVVRALFVEHEWADKREVGDLVPWSECFDLLTEETTYIHTWVQEHVEQIETTIDREPPTTEVAKIVYLLNYAPGVPATEENVARLAADRIDADLGALRDDVGRALEILADEKNYLHQETSDDGLEEYQLLTKDEISLVEEIEQRAKEIPQPHLRDHLVSWLADFSDWLPTSGDNRRFVETADERNIPLRIRYSLFRGITSVESGRDAVTVRVLVDGSDLDEAIEQWEASTNRQPDPLEDALVPIELGETFVDRLRRYLAGRQLVDRKTDVSDSLKRRVREQEYQLRDDLRERLDDAPLLSYDNIESSRRFGEDIERYIEERVAEKFPSRRVLERPFQHQRDARKLFDCFDGSGEWPLTDADADMLGVQLIGPDVELEGGWSEEFLDRYGDRPVDGATLLDQIEAPPGDYVGTPREALAALLLTLAAARKLHLRVDGEPIRGQAEMGRQLKAKARFEEVQIHFEPLTEASVLDHLTSLSDRLLDDASTSRNPDEIVDDLADWARKHHSEIRDVESWLTHEWSADADVLDPLIDALLEPAYEGDRGLSAEEVGTQAVLEAAKNFNELREVVEADTNDEDEGLWERFLDRFEALQNEHPSASLTGEFADVLDGERLPTASRLDDLLEREVEEENDPTETPMFEGFGETAADGGSETGPSDEEQDRIDELLEQLDDLDDDTPILITDTS